MESEELQERPCWAEMAPDLLANILARLSLQQLLVVVPLVCKRWQLASLNPLCYISLDLFGLSTSSIHRLLKQIILPRSQGRLLHVLMSVVDYQSPILYLLADSAPLLQTLHIPSSQVDDRWALYAAPLMPHIVDLNLNLCDSKMSHVGIEAFGKCCKHVLKLRRNHRWMWMPNRAASDDEAFAIARYFPFVKHLELQNNLLSEEGLRAILHGCPDLEHLDLAGCVHLRDMNKSLIDRCHADIKNFCKPTTDADDDPYDDVFLDAVWFSDSILFDDDGGFSGSDF